VDFNPGLGYGSHPSGEALGSYHPVKDRVNHPVYSTNPDGFSEREPGTGTEPFGERTCPEAKPKEDKLRECVRGTGG